MVVSDITIDIVKQYLRIDGDVDDVLLEAMLAAAINCAASYTGLAKDELDNYPDITIAVLAICADLYDVRAYTMNGIQLNPTAQGILGSHNKNLI